MGLGGRQVRSKIGAAKTRPHATSKRTADRKKNKSRPNPDESRIERSIASQTTNLKELAMRRTHTLQQFGATSIIAFLLPVRTNTLCGRKQSKRSRNLPQCKVIAISAAKNGSEIINPHPDVDSRGHPTIPLVGLLRAASASFLLRQTHARPPACPPARTHARTHARTATARPPARTHARAHATASTTNPHTRTRTAQVNERGEGRREGGPTQAERGSEREGGSMQRNSMRLHLSGPSPADAQAKHR